MAAHEIKRIRMKLGLTQAQLAELFGLAGKNTVSNIETGFRNPNSTIILMMGLLDSLPKKRSQQLLGQMFNQARRGRRQ
ncbi:MAG: type II toxin-antitoxin system MqsA family antitoxin [Bdellovibrionales bacterium]